MVKIDKDYFVDVCNNSFTMAEACRKLGMHWNTFRRYTIKFDCFNPNQSHKGVKLGERTGKIQTEDILNGKYPDYQTYKLKIRLIREGFIKDECCLCGWCGKRKGEEFSTCELHNKDENSHNHCLSNLELICPNCHSLTENYRSKNCKNEH